MLDKLRSAVNSWIIRIFLGILLVSFALWEIPSVFHHQSSNVLMTSGKSVIRPQTYQFVLNDITMRNSYAAGRYLTQDEINGLAIPRRVFSRMYSDVILDEEARQMKIGASDAGTAHLLGQDPLFRGPDNRFDKNRFIAYIQQIRATQDDVFSYLGAQAKRNQITASATGGLKAPDTLYSALLLYQRETRTADYLKLTPAFIGTVADPDEKTLADWFENNKSRFRAPEYRQITYMRMSVKDITHPQDVTEEAVKTFYEQNRERYSTPEKRTIEQLRFNTREAADVAAAKLAAGMSFDRLAAEEKQTLASIRKGPLTKAELPMLMASDVFNLARGSDSAVINDIQGPVIVRVVAVEQGETKPLASVQKEIRNEIADSAATATLRHNQKKIENSRFEGATLKELAAEYGLVVQTVTLDADGRAPDGKKLTDLLEPALLIPNVFQSAAGVDADPLGSGDGYLWYHVDKIIASHERPLDQVRDEAISVWKELETRRLLDEKAADMKKELDDGISLDVIAIRNKFAKKTESELQRGNASKKPEAEATMAIFSGPKGTSGVAPGADGNSRIVFKVTDVAEPLNTGAESLSLRERNAVSIHLMDDLIVELISFARAAHPVEINIRLYKRLLQQEE